MLKRRLLGLAMIASVLSTPACVFAVDGGGDDWGSSSYKRTNVEKRIEALEKRVEVLEKKG